MHEQQHRTALVAKYHHESDKITFSILKVAGVFRDEYLIIEGNDLKTVEEIDNEETNRALRLMWQNERITDTHRQDLESRLFCRTALVM
ncbi:MAG: hypothetical protein WCC97_08420 [Candidatus Acidiferrales bacterium]